MIFIFFVEGGGGECGVLGVLMGGSEPEGSRGLNGWK